MDTTDDDGYFSFRVDQDFANSFAFTDPDDVYLTSQRDKTDLKKRGSVHVINSRLPKAAEIAGTVTDDAGEPVENIEVRPYRAVSGKRVIVAEFAQTNAKGRFHLKVAAGDYKLKLRGDSYGYTDEWFADAATIESARVVTIKAGQKIATVDTTVTKKQTISGTLTIDGKKPIFAIDDRVVYELRDAAGTRVGKPIVGPRVFSFTDLVPGSYSVVARPSTRGRAYFTPVNLPVTLAAGQSVTGLEVNVLSTPPTATDKRDTYQEVRVVSDPLDRTNLAFKKGEKFSAKVTLHSYGSVTGGTLTFLAHGKKISTRTVRHPEK